MFPLIADGFVDTDEDVNLAGPISLSRAKSSSFETELAAALSAGLAVPLSRISGDNEEIERLAYAVPRSLITEGAWLSRKSHQWPAFRRNSREAAYAARMLRIGIRVRGLRNADEREVRFVVVPTSESSVYAEGESLRQQQLQVLHQISAHLARIGDMMQPPPRPT